MTCAYNLGLFNYCSPIKTGLKAVQTGVHSFHIEMNGKYYVYTKIFNIGEELVISERLNEFTRVKLHITNPDGTLYSGVLLDDSVLGNTSFLFDVQIIKSI